LRLRLPDLLQLLLLLLLLLRRHSLLVLKVLLERGICFDTLTGNLSLYLDLWGHLLGTPRLDRCLLSNLTRLLLLLLMLLLLLLLLLLISLKCPEIILILL
jgi:hypothetical protein